LKLLVEWLREGKILAVKGLGGFHLICDATNEEAVSELRRRKRRQEKPFAVMFKDLNQVKEFAEVSFLEEIALTSVESPIVILNQKKNTELAPSVSPDTKTVGAFLPYTPLHHLILRDFGKPIVATSCNLTDEPIMFKNSEVERVLGDLVDGALLHNREIARRCDDSVVKVMGGRVVPFRRSRGYAPLPVLLPFKLKRPVLAVGPHMKVTVALGKGNRVYISQHVGDVDNVKAEEFFKETVRDLTELFEVEPEVVVSDYHPGYFTTKFAKDLFGDQLIQIYHHHAHAVSVMAENEVPLDSKVIAFTFDGTGYGTDGRIWGGEVLISGYTEFERVLHLKYFPLPGGDRAVKEPYRVAVSLLKAVGEKPEELLKVEPQKLSLVSQMIDREVNSPLTSSMGRLFDGVSAILGIRYSVNYHAQGAILLEEVSSRSREDGFYPFKIENGEIDWRDLISALISDVKRGVSHSDVGMKFHNTVVKMVVDSARLLREETGLDTVALSGGVFQNRILTEKCLRELPAHGFKVLVHQIVPPNDGGISLGQAVYGGLI